MLSVFKKTYNKWRHERRGERKEKMKVHLQELADFHNRFGAHEAYNYVCENSENLGIYLGHALNINN